MMRSEIQVGSVVSVVYNQSQWTSECLRLQPEVVHQPVFSNFIALDRHAAACLSIPKTRTLLAATRHTHRGRRACLIPCLRLELLRWFAVGLLASEAERELSKFSEICRRGRCVVKVQRLSCACRSPADGAANRPK